MSYTLITTHVSDAQNRLLYEYHDAININNLISAIVGPIQNLENALQAFDTTRSINDAQGVQLDNLGKIVGVARTPGQTDASYVLSIYGQIGVNRSTGLAEDVISAFYNFTGATDCILYEFFPGACSIYTTYMFPTPVAQANAVTFIQTVVATGVQFLGFLPEPLIERFSFAGPQVGYISLGFGDVNDPTAGGFWDNETDPTQPD